MIPNNIRNMKKPYTQAGYPKKIGQPSFKGHVPENNFVADKYPEKSNPMTEIISMINVDCFFSMFLFYLQ